MGKEGDLWDDSVLINAFDQAISTYNKMHSSGKHKDAASVQEEAKTLIGENGSNFDTTRGADTNIPATDALDSGETGNLSKLEENHHTESQVDHLDSTSGQDIQNAQNGYAYAQAVDGYNQLVVQYYALEEKRLKILEQLNQYGGWNYQNVAADSNSGVPYSNSQDYSATAYQVSDPNAVCTCCPCYSQCLPAPCTSVPGCSLGGSSVSKPCSNLSVEMDRKMSFPCEDGKIHKMAMGAAEKALSTIRTTISGDFNVNEGKERNNSELEEINGSGTDLAAVLNAWYSAGFFTGKYLAEQSIQNKRQS
ncbi:uncharacterized protein LOC100799132 [Glycine max]|uniref:Survival Motor Neuron Gemin2-binding domain-containing protein n=1 Tax=Glycine max TaxID=3847 RepID=C6TE52_SOYBN|nr:uncharacterized protein LOC100799132 [Glycine max]ACU20104.1 unknown [Glycine max]|eukprot:NP_001242509.1 uncharacterized protein LOC100799132 [Glycine max]